MRISRLQALHNSPRYQAYFEWIMMFNEIKNGLKVSKFQQKRLEDLFQDIDDSSIQTFLVLLAKKQGIQTVNMRVKERSKLTAVDLKELVSVCDWDKISKLTNKQIVQMVKAAEIQEPNQR